MKIITMQLHSGNPIPLIMLTRSVESEDTQRCIRNLWKCTTLPLELHIVEDSGPSFSYGKFFNLGIRSSGSSEFILGMDDDAYPKPGCFEKLIEYYQKDTRLGCVGVRNDNSVLPSYVGWYNQPVSRFLLSHIKAGAPINGLRKYLFGNCGPVRMGLSDKHLPGRMLGFPTTLFLLKRQCFEDVGGFDEEFNHACVDPDFIFRILTSDKWYISTCPDATIYHEWRTTQFALDPKNPDLKRFIWKWNRERMRAVRRAAREGKFICNGV